VLNQLKKPVWMAFDDDHGYRLQGYDTKENQIDIYSYGNEEPEFQSPTFHTMQYCEQKLPDINTGGVDLIIDDPPYGNTQQRWDEEPGWGALTEQYNRVLTDDGLLVLFGQQPSLIPAYQSLTDNGFQFRYELIWEKKNPAWVSHYQPLPTHENIWIFADEDAAASDTMADEGFSSLKELHRDGVFVCGHCQEEFNRGAYEVAQSDSSQQHRGKQTAGTVSSSSGTRYPQTVLDFPNNIDEEEFVNVLDRIKGAVEGGATTEEVRSLLQFNEAHPKMTDDPATPITGQKPWRLIRWLLIAFSDRGDTVLDPHMGSGTVPDVCIPLCRDAIGIELSQKRAEVAEERVEGTLEKLRGLKYGTVNDTGEQNLARIPADD
jgi:DNA modification methylase